MTASYTRQQLSGTTRGAYLLTTGTLAWLVNCGTKLLSVSDLAWCPGTELNRRHRDFQSRALPTELPGRRGVGDAPEGRRL